MANLVLNKATAKLGLGALLSFSALGGCSSRPYFCQVYMIPPEAEYMDDEWILAARVCDTRISRDLFTFIDGAKLSISIKNYSGQVLAEREVLYIGEERLDFNGAWVTDTIFALKVYEDDDLPASDRTDAPIGEFVLSVPTP